MPERRELGTVPEKRIGYSAREENWVQCQTIELGTVPEKRIGTVPERRELGTVPERRELGTVPERRELGTVPDNRTGYSAREENWQ